MVLCRPVVPARKLLVTTHSPLIFAGKGMSSIAVPRPASITPPYRMQSYGKNVT